MKQSGYRTVFHIYLIFVLSLVATFLLGGWLFLQTVFIQSPGGATMRSDWPKAFTENFQQQIIFIDGAPQIRQAGMSLLQENTIGVQILDPSGREVFSYQKPEQARTAYSSAELLRLVQPGQSAESGTAVFSATVSDSGSEYVCRKERRMKREYFKYIFALLLFGSNGVVASQIGLNSYEIVLLRSAIGSIILIAIYFLTGHKLMALRYRRDMLYIALSGIAMALDWLLLFEAYQQIGVSLGMLINYCGPVIVVVLSVLLFKERMTRFKAVALIMAVLGAFLISGQAAAEGVNGWGLLCAGLSALAYAAMVIFNKLSKKITGMENAVLQLFFAAVTVAFFVGCKQGLYIKIASGDWLPILWISLLNTGGGCYYYFSSIGQLPVQTVAICGYIEPLSAVLFSVVFLHEMLMPLQIAGALLIVGGALIGEGIFKRTAR